VGECKSEREWDRDRERKRVSEIERVRVRREGMRGSEREGVTYL
jgi:hypothetical protein